MATEPNELPEDQEHKLDILPGNRPAEGARQGTPGEVLRESFQTSDAAGDFLGLDVDMEAMLGGESRDEDQGLALSATPMPEVEVQPSYGEEPGDDLDPRNVLEGDNGVRWENNDQIAVEEIDESDFEDEVFHATEGAGSNNRLALIALPFAVGAIAVAGVVLVPRFMGMGEADPKPVEVAKVERAPVKEVSEAVESTGEAATEAEAEDLVVESLENESSEVDETNLTDETNDAMVESSPVDVGADVGADEGTTVAEVELPGADDQPVDIDGGAANEVPNLDELIGELVGEAGTGAQPVLPVDVVEESTAPSEVATNTDNRPNRVDRAFENSASSRTTLLSGPSSPLSGSDSVWDVIYQGEEIPHEAVDSEQKVLTPRVGGVRVLMQTGEVFDGTLSAMGQGQIWLDTTPGRIGLSNAQIASMERIEFVSGDQDEPARAKSGERVKVRVPGGHLFGNVLATEADGTVMVELDSGGRVKLAKANIEGLGKSRVRILD